MAVNNDLEGQSSSVDALNDVSEAEWQIAQVEPQTVTSDEADDAQDPDSQSASTNSEAVSADDTPPAIVEFSIDDENAVRLPADANLGDLRLNGNNLELVQPDGSIFVILQGAIQGLTIYLGDVQLPSETVAALFQANNIQPAAGPDVAAEQPAEQPLPEGRGAYQDSSQGSIGDGIGITSLLPPTALAFVEPEQEELFEGIPEEENGDPTAPLLEAGAGAFVDEQALFDGSNPSSPLEKTSGNLAISTGPNTVSTLFIDGVDVTNGGTVTTGTYGTLVVTGSPSTGYSWEYTLDDNTTDHPDDTSTGSSEGISDEFTIVLTASNGLSTSDTLQVDVLDDGPTATADTGAVNEGALLTVLVGDGVLTNDEGGADGLASTAIQGVISAVGVDPTDDVSGGVGASILGEHGTLILAADGSYTYQSTANAITGNETDVFVYTIIDGDGDLSTTTLTINLTDGTVVAPDDDDVTVYESGMDTAQTAPDIAASSVTGSIPTDTTETDATNQLNASGGFPAITYALQTGDNAVTAGTYGSIQIATNGSYVYTLTAPVTSTSGDDGNNTEVAESFTYVATDANGNTSTGTITVNIVDDVPTATADTGAVNEGALLTVLVGDGVLTNDEGGADGLASTAIQGVISAVGVDPTDDVSGGVGASILGEHGTLILAADGSYTYQSTANAITGNETDVFVYTIIDGDGDLSTTTLTINLTDGTVVAPDDDDVTVYESGMDTAQTAPDIAASSVTGSIPTDTTETDATNQLNASGGFPAITYALQTGDNAVTAGTYGSIQIATNGSYVYTLTAPVTSTSGDDGNNTEVAESFTYVATDANGNTSTGTITVNIVDDVPTATADTGAVNEGALLTVLVGDGVLTNDEGGADGLASTAIQGVISAVGVDPTDDVSGGVGASILGEHGTLILAADGSYTYQSTANAITGNETDVFVYTIIDGDGDLSTTTLTINLTDGTVVAPDDDDVTVYESGMDTAQTAPDIAASSVTGSIPTDTTETDATNQLNASGGFPAITYALQTGDNAVTAGTYGSIQIATNGSYVYTLTAPVTSTSGDDGNNTEVAESFTYVATDANGNTSTGTITVNIVDDVPTATADTGAVNEGALLTVLVGDGVLTNDEGGADGLASTAIQGVISAVGVDPTDDVSGGVGASILGEHGTLILAADGSYTYQSTANAITGNETDVFVYTIIDGDGDLSTTTLTINLTDGTVVAPDDDDVTVYESGMDTAQTAPDIAASSVTGSIPTDTTETDATNQLNASGGFPAITYALQTGDNAVTAGTYGSIQIATNGSYVYTLTAPVTSTSGDDGNNTEVAESFTYVATDANGNTSTGTITVNIVDDVPTATADTGAVNEGALLTVLVGDGVLTNDEGGADGLASTAIQGVISAVGVDPTDDVSGGVGASILGEHGTLILAADGSYTYQSTANAITGNETDVFVYTIIDGDGDLSTTTLTINLTDGTVVAPDDDDVTVYESGMDTAQTAPDIAASSVTGSIPTDTTETDATNQLNASGGFPAITYALQTGDNAVTAGTYGSIQIATNGSYVYTLTAPVTSTSGDDGNNTEVAESFTYVATDANGNTSTGTITVNIVDDVPTATADTGAVNEGALLTVLVGDGVLTNDEGGADGLASTAIQGVISAVGVDPTDDVSGGVGASILGEHGTLILAADGSYTYQSTANAITGNETDVFVYTIIDGDGDLSTTTLTINLTDGTVVAPDDDDVTVYESGMDTAQTAPDIAASSVTGSIPTDTTETDATNQLNASGGFPAITYALQTGDNAVTAGTYGSIQIATNGSYVYTLTAPVTSTSGDDGNNTEVAESFTYVATDANGNTSTGTITVNIVDDVPTATADTGAVNEGALLTVLVGDGVLTNDEGGADGLASTAIQGVISAVGVDPTDDVSGGVGASILGEHGTLILAADGSYTYQSTANAITGNETDVFVYTIIDGDGDLSTTTLTINLTDGTVVAPDDDDVTVYESGMDTAQTAPDIAASSVTGSIPTDTTETDATNQLNASGGFPAITYALQTGDNAVTAGTYGSIQIATNGSYVYTLTAPVTSTSGDDGNNTEVAESFTYVATDANGNTSTGTITVNIVDDVPTATADTGAVNEGALLTVLVGDGVLTNDEGGADGLASTAIQGVISAVGVDPTDDVSGGVGASILGEHGTLILAADGSYTYQSTANAITGNETDVFVYTIIDGDGDLSTTTLTINLTDGTVVAPDDDDVTVYESGMDTAQTAPDIAASSVTGSIPTDTTETDATNQLNASGGFPAITYALQTGDNAVTAGTYGSIQIATNGSYVYTLTAPVTSTSGDDGNNTEVAESFTYVATDANGNTSTGTITVNIVDDVPTATADTGAVNEGALLTVLVGDGVLTNDEGGADGLASTAIQGVISAVGVDPTDDVSGGVGASILGEHGTLILAADGSYTYQSTANAITGNETDVFVYTIIDGDGDLSTTTLTINLTDGTVVAPDDDDVTVYESGMDTAQTAPDIAASSVTGSIPTDTTETDATNQLNASGGFPAITYALQTGDNAVTAGTYGSIQIATNGSYVYTLTAPVTSTSGDDGNNTEVAESFTYVATDANGNTSTGTITVNIVDDVPTATADTGAVNEGALLTVLVGDGVLTNDEGGADGLASTAIQGVISAVGVDPTDDVSGGVGASILGEHGTLILAADGSYTYQSTANAITGNETDVFVYTIIDGDGDLSTTTLTINLTDGTVVAPDDDDVTVYESGMDTAQTAPDIAASSVTGSIPTDTTETDATNQLNASGGFPAITYALQTGDNAVTAGTYGSIQIATNGSYVYTLTAPVTSTSGDDGNNTEVAESFTYVATDANGNTSTGTITVNIVDDVPTATADTGAVNEGALLTVLVGDGVLTNDEGGADGLASTAIQGVISAVGVDPTDDVSGGVGASILGEHGTLILAADGSYTYQSTANAITGNETDVFVYTIIDGDGDLSTTTLTINLTDGTVVAPDDDDVTVYESGMDTAQTAPDIAASSVTGSIPTDTTETDATNQLNASGGFPAITYALQTGDNAVTAGTYGSIQIATNGSYVYTLTAPVTSTSGDDGNNTEVAESFTYVATDANGNTSTGTITVNIVDDVPTATADTGAVNEGALLTVLVGDGVLTNDEGGADGLASTAIQGVISAVGVDPTDDVSGGVGASILGEHGTLILAADGSYTYQSTANAITGNETDVFVYTIIDGDGDLSTTTLTINLTDGTVVAPDDDDVTVYESGMDTAQTAPDIAASSVTGSIPTDTTETDATNQLNASGGFPAITYALQTGDNAVTAGTYGSIQIATNGSYVYTLTAPVTSTSGDDGNNTEVAESFTYVATDANGNTSTGTITVNIVDDVPTATADTGAVNEGALLTVLVGDGVLTNDEGGADGLASTAIQGVISAVGVDPTDDVSGGVGASILGEHGTLILAADGSYTYQSTANAITGNETDVFVYTIIDGDGDLSTTTLTINLTDGTVVAPDDDDVTVYESGMDTAQTAPDIAASSVTGSIPTDTTETDATNQLNASGGFPAITYALQTGDNAVTAGTYGSIQIATNGSYVYTLTAPVTSTSGDDGNNTEVAESFTYVATDANGNTSTGTITVNIVDDVPTATADTGAVNEGALLTVLVGDGVLTNDEGGADGLASTAIQGVISAVGVDPTDDVSGGVGASILGEHGTLILAADGSYTYQSTANAITGNETDVFVYTIIDGDGDLSTTTLTINLTDGTVVAPDDDDVTVYESGMDTAQTAPDIAASSVTGSIPTDTTETDATNQLNASGGFPAITYALQTGDNAVTAGTYGSIQIATNGSYVYTLTAPVTSTSGDDGNNTEVAESFTYVATDANGNTSTGTITVNIVDDVPTATADTGAVNEGALLTVLVGDGVLTNDEGGADGLASTAIQGVISAVGVDPTDDVSGGVGASILGEHGTLILAADGSYTYQSTANAITGNETDVFVYTIIDGDGDLSTTTLTINLTDGTVVAPDDDDVTVYESGMDTAQTAPDIAASSVTGSIPTDTTETDATNQLNASGGFPAITYALQTGDNAVTAGTYGSIQIATNGSYVYTLTAPVTSTSGDDGNNTEVAESFTYVATDANGNTSTGTITVNIVDDVPTATADTGAVNEGALLTVLVGDGVLTNDEGGADGLASTAIQGVISAVGVDPTDDVSGGVGASILGEHGTLILAADGSYTYQSTANAITGNETDVFVYTIIDGDGDLSTTTLTINLTDGTVVAPDDDDVTVYESGMDTAQTAPDIAASSVTGSIPTDTTETDATNQLNASGGFPAITYALQTGDNAVTAGTYGSIQIATNGSYVYTLTAPVTSTSGDDGNNTEVAESFTYVATDANGNTSTGTITVNIVDDVPTATADTGAVNEGALLTVLVGDGVLTNDEGGADGLASTAIQGVISAVGVDPTDDVSGGVGASILGEHGTLILAADGSYTYQSTANAITGNETDVFVYTIIDGDGDLSTTTLTINLTDGTVVAPDDDDVTVYESGMDTAQTAPDIAASSVTGSIPTDTTETDATNQLNASGGFPAITYALQTGDNAVTAGTYGSIQIATNGSYVYTLTAPVTSTSGDDGNNTEVAESFTYVATDANGNTSTGTITVNIVDDVPTATADTGAVNEGALLTVLVGDGVLTNDEGGADGLASTAIQGVISAVGVDPTDDVSGGVGASILGEHGTLILAADGSYTYQSTANAITGNETDVFVYTIIDGDGDLSTTTLTINLTDGTVVAPDDDDVTVYESGMDTAQTAPDIAASSVTGSIPTDTTETDATNQLNASGGFPAITYALQTGDNAVTAGTYGSIQIATNGSYVYTLTAPVTSTSGDDGNNTEVAESFTYVATDANGNTSTGTITVNIVDDVPTATADTGAVNEGALLTVLVGDGVLTNDEGGADGLASTAIQGVISAVGVDPTDDVSGGVGASILGEHGTLILAADGSYTYQSTANAITGNETDVFVYTIIDGDGDLSTTTLTINLTNGTDPTVTAPITLVLDDEHLADGSDPTADDFAQDTLTFTPGSNAISSIVFAADLTNLTGGLTWTRVSDTQITGTDGVAGPTIVTLDLSVSGDVATVTATLNDNYDSHPTVNVDDLQDLGSVGVVATDTGAASVTGTVNVDVSDDLPSAFVADFVYADDVTGFTTVGNINFADVAGADGVGSIGFDFVEGAAALDSDGNAIKLNGDPIFLYEGADSTILVGATGANATTGLAFTIDLDPVAGTYSFTIDEGTIANGETSSFSDLSGVGGGNNPFFALGANTAGGNDILITGSGSINTNANNIGIGSGQDIDAGEIIRFDFLTNITDVDPVVVAGPYYSLTSFAQEIDKVSGNPNNTADFTIKLIDADEDSDFYGDTGDTFITDSFTVKIYNGNPATTGVLQSTFNSVAGVAIVIGVDEGWYYEIESTTAFQAVQLEGLIGTDSFKVGAISIETINAIDPFTMDVALTGEDGDGDTTTGELEINFLPPAPTIIGTEGDDNPVSGTSGDDFLLGLGGTDILTGLAGEDVLIGGSGSDTMTGGADADTFIIGADSLDLAINDVITDYSEPDGDEIDLTEILGGLGLTNADDLDADGFVSVTGGPGTYTIAVDKDGTAGTAYSATDVATVTVADGTTISILFDDNETSQDVLL
ncbi:Ig-like domain-containing protein [Pararhizobium sp. IMCC21322]|uniref:Ig-like domain-containing protein n=1 Tax=Pararhizobium sp. IMCC21322 TaxID=3067903 RepID=UPI002742357D|nr:Ig-like domain-containing protein [Pararhizobium sp. IMCC21322]